MKSHVQIPASLLNGFADKRYVCRLNDKGEIERIAIKKCNIEQNYFSEKEENILNKYEADFGRLKKHIIDAYNKNKYSTVFRDAEQAEIAVNFFKMCIARNPAYIKELATSSILYGCCDGIFSSQGFAIYATMQNKETFEKMWKKKNFCVIRNESSNVGFVIPQNCIYSVKFNDNAEMYVLPITNRLAIALLDENKIEKYYVDEEKYYYTHTINNSLVDLFNKCAIYQEFASNKNDKFKCVYAQDRNDLESYSIKEVLGRNAI